MQFFTWANIDYLESNFNDLKPIFDFLNGIFIGGDLKGKKYLLELLKEYDIELHRWHFTMINSDQNYMNNFPERYAENRNHVSTIENPPYVNYYRWLCPSEEENKTHLINLINSTLEDEIWSGFHLDYIRFCDVILPKALQSHYGLDQSYEMPEFDYCYCERCVNGFKAKYGYDILQIENPNKDQNWKKFRYNLIFTITEAAREVCKKHNKVISAAVFPTCEIASNLVRQRWCDWRLDNIYPMLYNNFYNENIDWIINSAIKNRINCPQSKIVPSLYLPELNKDKFKNLVSRLRQNNFDQVSLFNIGNIDSSIIKIARRFD
jgi:hypothetical protein